MFKLYLVYRKKNQRKPMGLYLFNIHIISLIIYHIFISQHVSLQSTFKFMDFETLKSKDAL